MLGKEVLRENFQPRTCSGKKIPQTGRAKGNINNVVHIDIDGEQVDDVIIIDFPDFVQEQFHPSSVQSRDRKCPFQSVISIDDDESDDEDHPGIIAEGGGELDSDASSSKRFSPAASSMQNSVHINVDDCHVVFEKGSASNLPKSRQTSCAKDADRNRYGLGGSESDSSESDCSDCELVEVREQWEKASVKRKRGVFNNQADYDAQARYSSFHSNIYTDIEEENRTEEHRGSHRSSGKSVKENLSWFYVADDGRMDEIYCNLGTENPLKDSDKKVDQDSFNIFGSGSIEEIQSSHRSSDSEYEEGARSDDFSPYNNYKSYNFSSGITGASRFMNELGNKDSKSMRSSQDEIERQVDNNGSALGKKDTCVSFDERHINHDGLVSQQSRDRQSNSGIGAEGKFGTTPEDSLFCNLESCGKSRICNSSGVEVTADSDVISSTDMLFNDSKDKQDGSCLVESENPPAVGNAFNAQGGGVTPADERDIINEREKLKETNEYKQAIAEEWASRQQQLQIQAEEAQRLRKRKRAESKRLLDMQRRQKERIEEVRETQKKDEEFINKKEQLRVEVRKELNKLEMRCTDMASLLRGLGIQVGGGFDPLPNEVHAAYKRALFKFHPDRASKTDIREQVEAEEKFKLISRTKEKFLSTSCY